jgi:mRNA-degrading endonuclease toxin of MazEF toxin-antitoxin module
VPGITQGTILLVRVAGQRVPQLVKLRPVVVITPTNAIRTDKSFEAVAITTTFPKQLPDDHILLPYQRTGHPYTGLNKKAAAVCSWIVSVAHGDVVRPKGYLPAAYLYDVLKKVDGLRGNPSTQS